ncbi:MAG TPA: hypothetical protein ENJ00_02370, partial [Phycisphaerales bacterium]|nr:hypothetical protein [Phycisphaerales bacterium]
MSAWKRTVVGLCLLLGCSAHADTFYVSTTGADANAGTSPGQAWRHLAYAAQQVAPGDTVYIERGDYGNETLAITIDGTPSAPISFIGYQFVPGDRPGPAFQYGEALDPAVMPLLDGGDRSSGTGITLYSRSYVIVKNIQIRNYEAGVDGWHGRHLTLENIIVSDTGDINASYSGNGITLGGADDNTLRGCIVVNAAAEGYTVVGDRNHLESCRVYADDNSTIPSSTDYYIIVEGNDNTFDNCYAERVGDLEHVGHGIGIKGNGQNNTFSNCTGKNLAGAFYVRHRGARNNTFLNCTAIEGTGLLVRDGASDNTFINCHTINAENAVTFLDTDEDGGAQFAGRNNIFVGCTFENTTNTGINFSYYSLESSADNNSFVNCVFAGGPYLFRTERTNANNTLINCIVSGFGNLSIGSYALDYSTSSSIFWNCGFPLPPGAGVMAADPMFVDPNAGDFRLLSGSPGIDAGDNSAVPPGVGVDPDGRTRFIDDPCTVDSGLGSAPIVDIGAYEFLLGGTCPGD